MRRSAKTFLTFLTLAVGGFVSAELILVDDGVPKAVIVIGETPTRSAQFAAFELQHVVKLITGAELAIQADAPADGDAARLLVGESATTKALGVPEKPLVGEEYLVKFSGKDILLLGNDFPEPGKVDYQDPKTFPPLKYYYRSTTFAVYDFLEKTCGVRFYAFGDQGIAYQPRGTLSVDPIAVRRSPSMDAFRRPYMSRLKPLYSPRDIQLLFLRWRTNVIFGEVNHNTYSIYFRYWGPAKGKKNGNELAKLFVEKRPDYFAQGYAGASAPSNLKKYAYPNDPDLPPQVCASHPEPVAYFAEEAYKVHQGESVPGAYHQPPVMPGMPWYYPIQEDDNSAWCKCEQCAKAFADVPQALRYDYVHFDWINRIAAAAAKLAPDIGISTLAYSQTLAYPDPDIIHLNENISVQMCLGIQSWYHPGVYRWQHGAYKEWVDHEASNRPLTIWTYMLCPAWDARRVFHYDQFFPVLYPWQAGRFYKEFAQDGIRGYFNEVNHEFHLLEAYVANKIAFDSTTDPDALIDEYFKSYYGAAAAPMRRFYKDVEAITWNPDNYPKSSLLRLPKSSFTYGIHTEQTNWHIGTRERIAQLQKNIDEAERLAATPMEKQRVKWFKDHVWTQTVKGREAFEAREKVRTVPVPKITVGHAGENDGNPKNVDFAEAVDSGGWTSLDGGQLTTKPTLSIASDDAYLHIRYHENGDDAMSHRDDGLWKNNLEIFLAGQPDYPYGQMAVSPNGEFKAYRHLIVNGVVNMDEWPVKPTIDNDLDVNGWTLTMSIPLAQLLPDKKTNPGDKIHANVMRTRRWEGGASWAWSPIFAKGYAQGLYRMGEVFLAPSVQEGKLSVNGDFNVTINTPPDGWVQNEGDHHKPLGTISTKNGHLLINAGAKRTDCHHETIFPARGGDRIVLEFTASGEGEGMAGAYFNSGNGDGAGSCLKRFTVTDEPREHAITIPVTNQNPKRFVNGFRPVLAAAPNAKIAYSNLTVRIIPRK